MRPRYERATTPPPMRFQKRDGVILQTLYSFDGVLAKRHLKALFWAEVSERAMEKRLSLLYHNAYLNWPNQQEWRNQPIPEAICYLGWKGMAWLAGQQGIRVEVQEQPNETQLRRLERELREAGLRWVRKPRWSQLAHDLAIVDFRLMVQEAMQAMPSMTIEEWVPEGQFLSVPDTVSLSVMGKQGRTYQRQKQIRPDSYFCIRDESRAGRGMPARARFLLELDNATHDNPSFGREKVLPGVAYLKHPAYQARFGATSGRWLVVTRGGDVRMENLMHQTRQVAGAEANLFFFTTWRWLEQANPLTSPIWRCPGQDHPIALFA